VDADDEFLLVPDAFEKPSGGPGFASARLPEEIDEEGCVEVH
jgi:hypothetical protein